MPSSMDKRDETKLTDWCFQIRVSRTSADPLLRVKIYMPIRQEIVNKFNTLGENSVVNEIMS